MRSAGSRRATAEPAAEGVRCRVVGPGSGAWFIGRTTGPPSVGLRLRFAAPGDLWLVRPRADDAGWADPVALIEPGPARREPPCPLAAECGGCHWQQIDESVQLELKLDALRVALSRAGLAAAGERLRAAPAPPTLGYRYRARFQIGRAPAGGPPAIGFHRPGSRSCLDVAECLLLAPELARVYRFVRQRWRGQTTHGLTGVEITALPGSPGGLVYLNPRDRPPAGWPDLGRRLLAASGEPSSPVAGVSVRRSAGPGVPDGLGARSIVGKTPGGHPVAAAARGFLQAHLAAADRLADEVVRLSGAGAGVEIFELFAGTGLLSWRLAAAGAEVTSIENDPLAVEAAAALPAVPRGRLRSVCADARDQAAIDALAPRTPHAVWLADPPRSGLGPIATWIGRLGSRAPEKIVLVSCSLASLTRDLSVLAAADYRLNRAVLVDLFPQTRHVEVAARLIRTA
ncbi:MAG: class I SAM-dependent RNA methyltransferase [Acidobacteriota bacterium]|nr:MAG: class I SAM-dependent RNA methyltransferase [Acidobacteriota bacterium]